MPSRDAQGPRSSTGFRWLTLTHTQRWNAHYHSGGTGHFYQGHFKSFPIQEDDHYFTVLRYVERNALRAGLCKKAQDWPWGSLHHRLVPHFSSSIA